MFTTEKGKFLNCDQFWKEKVGKASYAKIQDDYNKYINDKGYNLFSEIMFIIKQKHKKKLKI